MRRDIAIDGPSGSGKTSVGSCIASEVDLMLVDSGLLYRVFTAAYVDQFPSDRCVQHDRLAGILERCISYEVGGTVLFDGQVLGLSLQDPKVDRLVSPVSAVPEVRAAVNRELRRIAALHDVVMVGRDIGTTVLPNALLKVFITADPDIRAKRRVVQLERLGAPVDYEAVLSNIRERDAIDSSREDSPLRCTEDYVKLDNSADGPDGVVQAILSEYRRRLEHVV
ncbi:MAG: (d)CMP kinase [Caldiserica bacterium]|nr:(d)CMP kinase [Caldisericota bacterium]